MSKKPKESLQHKVLTLIEDSYCPGISKHEIKGTDAQQTVIFSNEYRKSITTTAFDFVRFAKQEYGAKSLEDLPRAVQPFLESKADSCTYSTLAKYASELKKISHIIGQDFNCSIGNMKPDRELKRVIPMDRADFEKILSAPKQKDSASYKAIKIAGLTGLRVDSIPWLKYEDLRADGSKLFIAHAKGGRQWTVPLSREAQLYFKEITKDLKRGDYIITGTEKRLSTDALSKAFDRACEKAGLTKYKEHNTAFHAIRKMWATETYIERKALIGEDKARETVLRDLGHSETRKELAKIYIHA